MLKALGLLISSVLIILYYINGNTVYYPNHIETTNENYYGIVISGTKSGLGFDLAKELLKQKNIFVYAGVRKDKDKEFVEKELSKLLSSNEMKKLLMVTLDVTKDSDVNNAFIEIENFNKANNVQFYGIVNNAAIGGRFDYSDPDVNKVDANEKSLRDTYEVNIFGLMKLTNKFLPILKEQKLGRIINISSLMGVLYTPHCYGYCSSKYALEALSHNLRYSLKKFNISVSTIEPGFFKSLLCNDPKKCKDLPIVCSNKIINSLFDHYPQARYTCASVYGVPANVIYYLSNIMPDRLLDLIYYQVFEMLK